MGEILTDLSTGSVLAAIQANAYAFFIRRERILGKTVTEGSDLTWVEDANAAQVAWLRGLVTASEAPACAARTAACFTGRGLNEVYLVALETGDTSAAWQAAGACGIETEHVMVIALAGLEESLPSVERLSIETVSDDAGLRDCAGVISAGRDQWTAGFFQLTNPTLAGQEHMRYYLARVACRPVATAAQFFWGGLGGIWWVTTVPEFRGRGVASDITRAALADALRLGYRAVMLESLPAVAPMYRRLGFNEYCRINVYRWKSG
jgi:GNAT superfamily N-acetyltransferase